MIKYLLCILFVLILTAALAAQKQYGNLRNVNYVRNYDGDTITFNINQVHPIIGEKVSIRIAGVDTPELRGKCSEEKNLAVKAKEFVWRELIFARNIHLLNIKRGKYFRIIADVEIDKEDLAKKLIDKGYAVEYNGGKKTKNWCE